jgi:protein associated with RNAse G/E
VEKETIQTRFKSELVKISHFDLMMQIFKELRIEKVYHEKLLHATQQMGMLESERSTLKEFVKDNLKYIKDK